MLVGYQRIAAHLGVPTLTAIRFHRHCGLPAFWDGTQPVTTPGLMDQWSLMVAREQRKVRNGVSLEEIWAEMGAPPEYKSQNEFLYIVNSLVFGKLRVHEEPNAVNWEINGAYAINSRELECKNAEHLMQELCQLDWPSWVRTLFVLMEILREPNSWELELQALKDVLVSRELASHLETK